MPNISYNIMDPNRSIFRMTNAEETINGTRTVGDKNFQNSDQANLLELVKQLYSSLKNEIQLEYEMLANETECCLQNRNSNQNNNGTSAIDIILLNGDLEKMRSMSTLARNKLNKLLNDETLVNTEDPDENRKFELTMDLIDSMERRLHFVCNERKKVYKKCCEIKAETSRQSRNQSDNHIHSQALPSCATPISSPFTNHGSCFMGRNERDNFHSQSLTSRISFTNSSCNNSRFERNSMKNVQNQMLSWQKSSTNTGHGNLLFNTNENENRQSQTLSSQSMAINTGHRDSPFDMNESENVHSSSRNIGNKRQSTDANPIAVKRSKIMNQEIKLEPLEDEASNKNIESTERLDPVLDKCFRGFVNLERLGRTCYINSVVQCLFSISLLKKIFIDHSYFASTNANILNGKEAKVTKELARLFEALYKAEHKTVSPKGLKTVIGESNRQFAGLDQQDAHEFLTFLLDKMHEELSEESDTQPDESWSEAKVAWHESLKNRRSIISDLFFGQMKIHVSCGKCSRKDIIYKVFSTLKIPLLNTDCGMLECVERYLDTNLTTRWRCPRCKCKTGYRKINFTRLPPVLIIQVGRFTKIDGWYEKTLTKISARIHKFVLNTHLVRNSNVTVEPYTALRAYALGAVVRHLGEENGGTYEAVCRLNNPEKCIKYCNEGAYECTLKYFEGPNEGNYIAFYQSTNFD